jgi:4-amino-4-deoxy-L-arabinose transferase-like glycosyltransferase
VRRARSHIARNVTRLRLPRPPKALVVIVVVGFALRLAWCLYAAREPQGLYDPFLYRLLSDAVAHGHGYDYPPPFNGVGIGYAPTAYYPPGYPLLLAAFEWVTLHTFVPEGLTAIVVVVNLVAGVAAIVLAYGIGRRLADVRTGLIAAALVALWPNLILHTAVTLSETLFIALLLLTIFLVVRVPLQGYEWAKVCAAGAVLGLATLVRPVSLPLIGAFAVAWLVAGVPWRTTLVRTGVVTLTCIAVLMPWIVRNRIVMGAAVLTTNTGDNLCMSRQPHATGGFQLSDYCNATIPGLHRPQSEIRKDEDGRHIAFDFIRDNPGTEVRLWFSRLRYGYQNDADGVRVAESYDTDRFLPQWARRGLSTAANAWFVAVSLVALASLWWWLRGRNFGGWLLFGSAIGVGVIPIVVFFGDARFHVPIDPLLAILAAGLLSGWLPSTARVRRTSDDRRLAETPQPLPVPGGG